MRKIVFLFALCLPILLSAQQPATGGVQNVTVDPSGNCAPGGFLQYNTNNGKLWSCGNVSNHIGTWIQIGGTAYLTGSGTVNVTSASTYVSCTGACTVTPLTPSAGVQLCVDNTPGTSTAITLAALSGVQYSLTSNSAYGTANHTVVSGGALTDSICIVGVDATHYKIKSYTGTWTD